MKLNTEKNLKQQLQVVGVAEYVPGWMTVRVVEAGGGRGGSALMECY